MRASGTDKSGYFWGHFGDKVSVLIRYKGKERWINGVIVEDDWDFYGPFIYVRPSMTKRFNTQKTQDNLTPDARRHVIWVGRASGAIKLGW